MAESAERQILKFIVPRSPEMAFSDSSVPLFTGLRLVIGISYRNPCNFL
jgi:hypothetical protein